MSIDFSDLGGKKVSGGVDFSDLGGQKVQDSPTQQTPQKSIWERVTDAVKSVFTPKELAKHTGEMALDTVAPGILPAAKVLKIIKDNPRQAAALLPTAGAIALPLAAAPETGGLSLIGLAALGGGAGAAGKQIVNRATGGYAPQTSLEAAKDIGIEGAKGAAGQAVGMGTGKAIEAAGNAMKLPAYGLGGFKFLKKTPLAKDAAEAADTMTAQGVAKATSSPADMLGDVRDIQKAASVKMGQYLKSQGFGFDTKEAMNTLEQLRPRSDAGAVLKGGVYDEANAKIDRAIATIKAHGNGPMSFQTANNVKGQLQDLGDFSKYSDAKDIDRQIAGKFRSFLDSSLEKVSEEQGNTKAYQEFLKNKNLYKTSAKAEEGLQGRVAKDNIKRLSLSDLATGAGMVGAEAPSKGLPVAALYAGGAIAGKRVAEKFGPQAAVQLGQAAANNPQVLPSLAQLAGGAVEPQIQVKEKTTGSILKIPVSKFDSRLYEKI